MKKILAIFAMFCVLGFVAPAAQAGTSPNVFGIIYQNTTTPGDGFCAVAPARCGTATAKSIFGLIATGDCSVRQAMRNGGITQLSHYDIQRENILGIMTITTRAYGR